MSYEVITATRYKCRCEATDAHGVVCGHKWKSDEIPDRCAKCKRLTWNASDKRRKRRPILFKGKSQTISEWAIEIGIPEDTLRSRINKGWDLEECFFKGKFMAGRKPNEDPEGVSL